ncbi:glutamate receptor ionotropic, NMDA 1-like [Dermacentor andersoni]|uniref:glutamate receptor ionotropic, NMDA 1-like n=1 Tax=Dermacentor andersoni TaxID=34620 RepID=UPI003B3A8A75
MARPTALLLPLVLLAPLLVRCSEPQAPALLAALPARSAPALARALRRALARSGQGPGDSPGPWLAVTLAADADTRAALAALCAALENHRPLLVVSMAPPPSAFTAALAAGYAKLPVLAYTGGYLDRAAQEASELYLSLDPGLSELTEALYALLSHNRWYHFVLVTDESPEASTVARRLATLCQGAPWRPLLHVTLPAAASGSGGDGGGGDGDDDQRRPAPMLSQLARVSSSPARVLLLFAEPHLARDVLDAARTLNLLAGEHLWLFVERADPHPRGESPCREDSEGPVDVPERCPLGALSLRLRRGPVERTEAPRWLVGLLRDALARWGPVEWPLALRNASSAPAPTCWEEAGARRHAFSTRLHGYLRAAAAEAVQSQRFPPPVFDVLNLVPAGSVARWRAVGNVTRGSAQLDSVLWPSGPGQQPTLTGPRAWGRQRFRVVTAYAAPFVMAATRIGNGSCLSGVPCLQVSTADPEKLAALFAHYHLTRGATRHPLYNVTCCAGIAMDLLTSLARDLAFDFDLYLVADGSFGTDRGGKWGGITADLISGAAHLAATAYSVTSSRSRWVDFSVPYFHSGVSCLAYAVKRDVPLSAFLIPFSVPLWLAIFLSLKVTALAAALYEWFSPFGLNPWGRQRTKNFSLASALWVMWSLLFSHLVAFKAPKSWPNKVLINLWGCFSVIFLASYTANIAAHFAGLFFQMQVHDFHDTSLLSQRTGTARGTAAEGYVFAENKRLWEHIQRFGVPTLEDGLESLRSGALDVLIGDTAVLNYYRANEPSCRLRLLGDSIFDDAYAVGMARGFPLAKGISELVLRYNALGYLDQLHSKWYGRAPCLQDGLLQRLDKPLPLGVRAVAGLFLMLLVGLLAGSLVLIIEHLVFRYALPGLRARSRNCFWKSPNLMFFSQKLYRFINTVELVSPHHSAKEIVSNLREGQIASLFQKSVKRKIKEEARRRKSKSQFFEMIQEVRRAVQQQQSERAGDEADSPTSHQDDGPLSATSSSGPLLVRELGGSPSTSSSSPASRPCSPCLQGAGALLSVSLETLVAPRVPVRRRRARSLGDLSQLRPPWEPRRVTLAPSGALDDVCLQGLSREQLVRRWRDSERRLLNLLREAVREKQALERKLAFLHNALRRKPP